MDERILKQILEHIMSLTHSTVREFHEQNHLLQYHGKNKDTDAVLVDESLYRDIVQQVQEEFPLLYLDFYPIYYLAVKDGGITYVIGPVNGDYTVETYEEQAIGAYFAEKHHLNDSALRIPYCEFTLFVKAGLLLFNIIKETNMTYRQALAHNSCEQEVEDTVKRELNQIYFRYQESSKLHNPYDQEVRELNSIREGSMEKLLQSMDETFEGDYAVLSKNPLQAAKNIAIVSLATTARAAIDGGLLPEESFSVNDSYILRVDSAIGIPQIYEIVRQAKIDYVKRVNERRQSKQKKRIVEEAKNIIYQNMHSKIVVQEIAEQLSVTPQYLSAIFKKVEGVTVNEYIMQKKIGLAENMLTYSDYGIEDIGYYLGFCTQSHFGKKFREITGVTPGKYRDRYGTKGFHDKS